MDQPDVGAAGEEPGAPPAGALDPESPHYQPWAEKQISNAAKQKRPLEQFLEEFEAGLAQYGELPSPEWDRALQDRLLARFSRGGGESARRRGRRRTRAPGPVPVEAGKRSRGPRPAAPPRPASSEGERRRRRRRRPRGGPRPPEAGAGA